MLFSLLFLLSVGHGIFLFCVFLFYFVKAKIQQEKQTIKNIGKPGLEKSQSEENKVNFIDNVNSFNENTDWFTGVDESKDSDIQKIKEDDNKISELAAQVENIDTGNALNSLSMSCKVQDVFILGNFC